MHKILKNDPQNFVFYQAAAEDPLFENVSRLIQKREDGEDFLDEYRLIIRKILRNPGKVQYASTPWKDAIIRRMLIDNSVNRKLERGESLTHEDYVLFEMEVFQELYHMNWEEIAQEVGDPMNPLERECFSASSPLSYALENATAEEILAALTQMIEKQGLGVFAGAKLFKLNKNGNPVRCRPGTFKPFDDIVGYESQKEKLIDNTKALLAGSGSMNVLLYGDMGTGKSSMVKALSLLFEDTPLRFLEMHKGEFKYFSKVFELIRESGYPFILFVDDLSFEDGEQDYKDMKNALEGSFEDVPANLAIYATSNRRSLITQTKSERADAVHAREVMEEKLSLLSRFGLTLQFSAPMQNDYLEIVRAIARQKGIDPEREGFEEEALQYAIRHLNRSGRTAEQFIKSLLARDSLHG